MKHRQDPVTGLRFLASHSHICSWILQNLYNRNRIPWDTANR